MTLGYGKIGSGTLGEPGESTPEVLAESGYLYPRVSLALEIIGRNGTELRIGPDEERLSGTLISASWETSLPGGFGPANMTVPRPDEFESVQAKDFYGARLYISETGQTVWAGRVTGTPQVDGTTISIACEGWANSLGDDKTARENFIDKDVSKWGDLSATAQASVIINGGSGGLFQKASASTTGAGSVLAFNFSGVDHNAVGEWVGAETGWYGNGVPFNFMLADFVGDGTGDVWKVVVQPTSTGDRYTGSVGTPGVYVNDGLANSVTEGVTYGGATAKYAQAYVYFHGSGVGRMDNIQYFKNLTVMGMHGMTLQGSWPSVGLYGSQIAEYIIGRWAPLLHFTTGQGGTIEPTNFVIGHSTYPEWTTAKAMIGDLAVFGGNNFYALDYGCYGVDGKEFFIRQPGTYGTTWIARRSQAAEDTGAGPDSSQLLNGVVVTYSPDGQESKSIGPPGSGADTETESLLDASPGNPANNDGSRHWETVNVGTNDEAAACLVGELTLNTRNSEDWRGSIVLKDTVEDEAGNVFPVELVRSGDEIVIADDEDTTPRRIVSTSSGPGQTTANVGAPPDEIEAYLARIANQQVGAIG